MLRSRAQECAGPREAVEPAALRPYAAEVASINRTEGLQMRHLLTMCLAMLAVMAGTAAASAQGWYGGAFLGVNFTHDGEFEGLGVDTSFDTGYAVGAYIGRDMGSYRLEGELSYRENDVDNIGGVSFQPSSLSTTALMANILYDFSTTSAIVPYIGGGIGVGFSTFELLGVDGDATDFAAQLIVGGAYRLSGTLDLTVDYRLFTMFSPDYDFPGGSLSQDYTNSTISLGLRSTF